MAKSNSLAKTDPQPPLPNLMTKDEFNLAEYPFALLSDRAPKGVNALQFNDTFVDSDGRKVDRRWIVNGSEAHGLPTASDEPIYLALMQMGREQGFEKPTVRFVFSDLLKRVGLSDDGRSYKRVRASLLRLTGVQITADRAFYDKAKGRYSTKSFHILDSFEINGGQGVREESYVRFSDELFGSIQSGAINTLNFGVYLSLESSVARRLYRYLDKACLDGKSTYRIGIHKLAFERLGMSRGYYPSQIKRLLEPAHEELRAVKFLESWEYVKGREDELIIYRFAQESDEVGQIVERLVERGVTASAARRLVSQHGLDRVNHHIASFDRLRASGRLRASNPGGWLRMAIDQDFQYPEPKAVKPKPSLPVIEVQEELMLVSDEQFSQASMILGPEKMEDLRNQITLEVATRPTFRGRTLGKGAQVIIEAKIRDEAVRLVSERMSDV